MRRTLHLKRERLTELTGADLTSVVGAREILTLPINQCVLSLNPCYFTEYQSCHCATEELCN